MSSREREEKLASLYERIKTDSGYRSTSMGDIFVPGDGSLRDNTIVFIGEAPGKDEEKLRKPFVGAAGTNLNGLLQGIGLSRSDVFITNLIKYRPFHSDGSNRNPTAKESRRALPYLIDELRILCPPLVVCLGLSSAKCLLETPNMRMCEANGTVLELNGLRVLVTYHPSPFNYMFGDKRKAMEQAFHGLKELLPC